jgi:murein L,D-transpeptidase YafK
MRRLLAIWLILCATLGLAGHTLAAGLAERSTASADTLLDGVFQAIRDSRLDHALREVDRLISLRPDFKLAHLIKGDLLLARARPLPVLGAANAASQQSRQSLSDLREEARVRLLRYVDQPDPELLPKQILQLSSEQKYALLADASRARLYLFENVNGEPRLLRDFYMTIGRNGTDKQVEGDKKTPMGLYYISERINPKVLDNFYGAGAFPLTYPNEWDQMLKRGGHGIWLHGVPFDTYSRPPRSSDGCVVVTNPDLNELSRYVQVGVTPVLIAERTDWIAREAWQNLRQELLDRLGRWRMDWESRDAERFLAHYASRFLEAEGGEWAANKQRNIANKDWIRVTLNDTSLFLYSGGDMAVANFSQHYASDKLTNVTQKRLYLRQERDDWRIALETSLEPPARYAQR